MVSFGCFYVCQEQGPIVCRRFGRAGSAVVGLEGAVEAASEVAFAAASDLARGFALG